MSSKRPTWNWVFAAPMEVIPTEAGMLTGEITKHKSWLTAVRERTSVYTTNRTHAQEFLIIEESNREAWRAAIHGVAKSRTWLSDWTDWMFKNKFENLMTRISPYREKEKKVYQRTKQTFENKNYDTNLHSTFIRPKYICICITELTLLYPWN